MGQELIRLLEKSENWIPGSQNGKMVRNLFSITLFIKTDKLKKSFFTNKFNAEEKTQLSHPNYPSIGGRSQ